MASGVAAAGAAVAFYFYSRRVRLCGFGRGDEDPQAARHFESAHAAPANWVEALFFFSEALRYMYNESLGRWRTADLLIGLAYLARQESAGRAVADVAATGRLVGQGRSPEERQAIKAEFRRIAHLMKYCQALRERRLAAQTALLGRMGVAGGDILLQQSFAGMLKPSYVLVRDHAVRSVVLAIRGTHSIKDLFTSLTSASKPHHMLSGAGVVLGYSHFGMLAAARWVLQQVQATLRAAVEGCPGYSLQIVGHSLGAGTAALLTTALREMGGAFADAQCLAVACPACMTLELAQSCGGYVTTIVNGHDMIPTLSPGAADALREEVVRSSWYEAFRADMRSSVVVRAVEASVGSVGSVTSAASSWTALGLSAASRSFRACYQRRGGPPALKRSNSDSDSLLAEAELAAAAGRVEVARDWAGPEGDSPEWGEVLQMLQPFSGDAERHAAQQQRLQQQQEQERETQAPTLYRRAGELVSRLLLRDCRATAPDEAAWPPPPHSGAAPDAMERLEASGGVQMARSASDAGGALQHPMSPGRAFREELRAAERDLREQGAALLSPRAGGDAGSGPPSPGGCGGPGGRPAAVELQARRMTYPAGRIIHLVPARLVFGEQAVQDWRRQLEESAAANGGAEPLSEFASPLGGASPSQAEQFVVVRSGGAGGVAGRSVDGLAPPIPPAEDFVLLEDVPQEAYGRIRLCSRMLADHFIPAYLGSLETALRYVEAGYPKRIEKQE